MSSDPVPPLDSGGVRIVMAGPPTWQVPIWVAGMLALAASGAFILWLELHPIGEPKPLISHVGVLVMGCVGCLTGLWFAASMAVAPWRQDVFEIDPRGIIRTRKSIWRSTTSFWPALEIASVSARAIGVVSVIGKTQYRLDIRHATGKTWSLYAIDSRGTAEAFAEFIRLAMGIGGSDE